jgi:hypothetical protein
MRKEAKMTIQHRLPWLVALAAALLVFAVALAPAPAWAADLTGTWNWTVRPQGQELQRQGKFKQEGEKLTGTVSGTNLQPVEIREGKVKGDEVSFVMIREQNGQQLRISYQGKVSGDTIKGKIKVTVDGQELALDWEAKRAQAAGSGDK